jgi:hypothetical protein
LENPTSAPIGLKPAGLETINGEITDCGLQHLDFSL